MTLPGTWHSFHAYACRGLVSTWEYPFLVPTEQGPLQEKEPENLLHFFNIVAHTQTQGGVLRAEKKYISINTSSYKKRAAFIEFC